MLSPMDPLPTSPDDPRLNHWYQTIELAPGVVTKAVWDHRPTVDLVGLPKSLEGKTALDVGTADGFWAFELERRGADRVAAIDLPRLGDVDLIPRYRATCSEDHLNITDFQLHFATAHRMLKSKVDYKWLSVYDLSPETIGGLYDIVYCGSTLLHLRDPVKALTNMRSVCKDMLVVETASYHNPAIDAAFPDAPLMWFGRVDWEGENLGGDVTYWSFTTRALCDMLLYAGFSWVEPLEPFPMQRAENPGKLKVIPVVAHVAPNPDLQGCYKGRPNWPTAPAPNASGSIPRRILSSIRTRLAHRKPGP